MSRFARLGALSAAAVLALAPGAARAQAAADAVPAPAAPLPLKHAPQPTTGAITAADLMTRLYIFADDSMMGREAGTEGNVKGTNYIASEVRRLGLKPAGEDGGYFQTLPFKKIMLDPSSSIVIGGTGTPARLAAGTDWAAAGRKSVSLHDLPVVYGGTLGDSTAMISGDQAAGKMVVFAVSNVRAPQLRRGFGDTYAKAAAIVVSGPFLDPIVPRYARPQTFVDDPSRVAPTPNGPSTLLLTTAAAGQLFASPMAGLAPGAPGRPVTLELKLDITPVPFPARNVVAILPGRDPAVAGEYVAIGGHNDHIGTNTRPVDHDSIRIYNHLVRPGGAEDQQKQATPEQQAQVNQMLADWRKAHPNSMRADSISNGADDDGSGSVSVLEIAEKFASLKGNDRPRRSILFVWHVGEEKGLLGSEYYTDHPTVPRDSIVAQLNMDMVGRGRASDVTGQSAAGQALHGGPDYLQLVGSRRLSTELGNLVEQVNKDDKSGFVFDYSMDANGHPMNIYCRSDHYEYARYGIPIVFFTTGGHSDYHQVTDEPEYIDYDHMARVDNLVYDIAQKVANLDHRVVVDQPKPDPHGVCRQ
ncbi:hypothetical protein tb265_15490 [Gemmatimonadetes bacterium T265]|nr:hypothetical protein tb265_15490 [Gemmatimonadetes bacterium T265]